MTSKPETSTVGLSTAERLLTPLLMSAAVALSAVATVDIKNIDRAAELSAKNQAMLLEITQQLERNYRECRVLLDERANQNDLPEHKQRDRAQHQ
jgi:hypothetical protein